MIVKDLQVGLVVGLRDGPEDQAETINCIILFLGGLGGDAEAKIDLSLGLGWSDITCFDAFVVCSVFGVRGVSRSKFVVAPPSSGCRW